MALHLFPYPIGKSTYKIQSTSGFYILIKYSNTFTKSPILWWHLRITCVTCNHLSVPYSHIKITHFHAECVLYLLYLSLSILLLIFVEILVGVPPAAGPVFSYKLSEGGVSLKKLWRLIIFYKFPCKTKPTQISISCLNIITI